MIDRVTLGYLMAGRHRHYSRNAQARHGRAPDAVAGSPSRPHGLTGVVWIAAAVLLFEEWFWARSNRAMARLAVIAHLTAVGDWIRRMPPTQALALFVVPVLVIYPFKVLALVALARGDFAVGGAAFVGAKLAATAVFARLYQLTEPAIVHFPWIRSARDGFLRTRIPPCLARGARALSARAHDDPAAGSESCLFATGRRVDCRAGGS